LIEGQGPNFRLGVQPIQVHVIQHPDDSMGETPLNILKSIPPPERRFSAQEFIAGSRAHVEKVASVVSGSSLAIKHEGTIQEWNEFLEQYDYTTLFKQSIPAIECATSSKSSSEVI
jgi:hypothetical protein